MSVAKPIGNLKRMKRQFLNLPRYQKQLIAAATDSICLPLLFFFSLFLHLEKFPNVFSIEYAWLALVLSATSIPIFIKLGLYRSVIRYIDQKIIVVVTLGATLSVLLLGLVLTNSFTAVGKPWHSSTLLWTYWINIVSYLLASRFAARGIFLARRTRNKRRVAIYGAGDGGIQLAVALMSGAEYRPAFFIDDNKQIQNTTIRGIRVFAPDRLPALVVKHRISSVMLAIPSLTPARQRQIIDRLAPLKIKIKVTPPIAELIEGNVRVEDVRQIEIEDLLSRDPVEPRPDLLSALITGKSVMISGAGGSIGAELCRQIAGLHPRCLVLLDISESSLYTIEQEIITLMASHEFSFQLVACVGSVQDFNQCKDLMNSFAIETVYHAAAYKHVPLVEHNPINGIRNNVFGTLNFAKAAMAANVKCFVLISTDKAVRPTNVMGATKRLSELILQAFSRRGSHTRFAMVRFGNVLGSSGSVVPMFRSQIAGGGPVTVTHPEITRYFMTVIEAAQLVLQASSMCNGGDVFVLDMGQPTRIADLAIRMIHLSGHEVKSPSTPKGDIEIKYIGLRPGEKLYEELLIGTNVTGTEHPLIMRAKEAEIDWPFLEIMLAKLDDACLSQDHEAIRVLLTKIVAEYRPSCSIADLIWQENERLHAKEEKNLLATDPASP
jgi:FlaA1/EpsC-like NDP-sugar epimerase